MSKNYVILAGGAGCLGITIAKQLVEHYNIIIFDNSTKTMAIAKSKLQEFDTISYVRIDVSRPKIVEKAFDPYMKEEISLAALVHKH